MAIVPTPSYCRVSIDKLKLENTPTIKYQQGKPRRVLEESIMSSATRK